MKSACPPALLTSISSKDCPSIRKSAEVRSVQVAPPDEVAGRCSRRCPSRFMIVCGIGMTCQDCHRSRSLCRRAVPGRKANFERRHPSRFQTRCSQPCNPPDRCLRLTHQNSNIHHFLLGLLRIVGGRTRSGPARRCAHIEGTLFDVPPSPVIVRRTKPLPAASRIEIDSVRLKRAPHSFDGNFRGWRYRAENGCAPDTCLDRIAWLPRCYPL